MGMRYFIGMPIENFKGSQNHPSSTGFDIPKPLEQQQVQNLGIVMSKASDIYRTFKTCPDTK